MANVAAPKLRKIQMSEQQWSDLRTQLVQYVTVHDGEFEYRFRCETGTELWRAKTLLTKEAGTVDWIRAQVRGGDVFYDIGANIGLYTLLAGKRVGARGMVYAFEPHVGNVQSLLHNVGGNGLGEQVKVISCALNDREGFFDFHYHRSESGSSMSQLGDLRDAGGQQFAPVFSEFKYALTIDQLLLRGAIRPADHIKMDVDGNELLILRGMREYLGSPRGARTIQVEINSRHKAELMDFMATAGYDVLLRHDTQHGKQALARGDDPESMGYNMIFQRRANG